LFLYFYLFFYFYFYCSVYTESLGKLVDVIEKIHVKFATENTKESENNFQVAKKKDKEDEMMLNLKRISKKFTHVVPEFGSIFKSKLSILLILNIIYS